MTVIRNQNMAPRPEPAPQSDETREQAAEQIRGAVEARGESVSADEVAAALDQHQDALSELGAFIEQRFKVVEDRIEAAFQALHKRLDALGPRASEPPKSDPTPNG